VNDETTDRTMEQIRHALTEARNKGEESSWEQGALICDAIRVRARELPSNTPQPVRRAARKELLKDLASDAACSPARIFQLAEVFAAFTELRDRSRSFTWHRAVLLAAKRTKRMPLTMLDEAVQENLDVPSLNRLGQKPKPGHGAVFRGKCALGHVVQYVAEGEAGTPYRGTAVPCGLCVGEARRAGSPDESVGIIGAME
jgi:hypothetical protein